MRQENADLTRSFLVDVVHARLKMRHGLSGFGALHVVLWLVLIVGSLTAARSSRHRVQAAWGIGFFAVMSLFEYLHFSALRTDQARIVPNRPEQVAGSRGPEGRSAEVRRPQHAAAV